MLTQKLYMRQPRSILDHFYPEKVPEKKFMSDQRSIVHQFFLLMHKSQRKNYREKFISLVKTNPKLLTKMSVGFS